MPVFRLICFANSTKLGGRCVAGVRADGGGWIRPVSSLAKGELLSHQHTYAPGNEVRLMDLADIQVTEHRPLRYQKENWLISDQRWRLIARPTPTTFASVVKKAIVTRGPLLGFAQSGRHETDFPTGQAASSLALISPDHPTWQKTKNIRGQMQVRCLFPLDTVHYDVVVTDPEWKQQFVRLDFGTHDTTALGVGADHRLLLCVSVSEPLRGYCYLLVAAVLLLDSDWQRALFK
jgi:hypothetical protein